MSRTLLEDLNDLHAAYVDAINSAVAEDDLSRAEELAACYDRDAVLLMALREGRADLAPRALSAASARRARDSRPTGHLGAGLRRALTRRSGTHAA